MTKLAEEATMEKNIVQGAVHTEVRVEEEGRDWKDEQDVLAIRFGTGHGHDSILVLNMDAVRSLRTILSTRSNA